MAKTDLEWYGDDVYKMVETALRNALTEFALKHETAAKGKVRAGRGVITGTYRRSIHAATPNYSFSRDNVKPSKRTPERGGRSQVVTIQGKKIVTQVGSGMIYAMVLEKRYGPIMGGYKDVKGEFPSIIQKHAAKQGLF